MLAYYPVCRFSLYIRIIFKLVHARHTLGRNLYGISQCMRHRFPSTARPVALSRLFALATGRCLAVGCEDVICLVIGHPRSR